MFAVRGIAVSSAIFVLLYSALSLVVCGVWRILCRRRHRDTGTHSADFLFVLRMAPFILAAGATLLFAVPSFLLLDSKHVTGIILRSDGSGAYAGGVYDIIGPTGTSLGYPTVAAKAGDIVELFGVGFGPTGEARPVA